MVPDAIAKEPGLGLDFRSSTTARYLSGSSSIFLSTSNIAVSISSSVLTSRVSFKMSLMYILPS